MKKRFGLILCFAVLFVLAGCGSNNSAVRTGNQPAGVNEVLETGMAEENSKKDSVTGQDTEMAVESNNERQSGVIANAPVPTGNADSQASLNSTDVIDVDLTSLSSTLVYSEVYNLMVTPEDYIGKTVKMDGSFAFYHDEGTDNYYFACIIADATACCSQGIEFVLTENYTYPDDYPEAGEEICVVGVFDTYQEGEYTYCTLRNATLV